MFKKIKDLLLKILAKPMIEEGSTLLENQLRTMATVRPKLFKTLVVSVHAAAKSYGPDLVASTATDLDDLGLSELLEALETVAGEFGIDLTEEASKIEETN